MKKRIFRWLHFYRKLRENKFTLDEVITIVAIIHPEQYEFEILNFGFNRSNPDSILKQL